jgi:hypothetical protein
MGASESEDRRGENYNFSFAVGAFHDASEWAALALAVALLLSVGEIRFQDTHNRPGILYSTESGVFDPAWSTSNPTIAAAGQTDFGTRLKADSRGIPSGAQLWLDVTAVNQNSSRAAELTSSESGPFHQVSATRTLTNGAGTFGACNSLLRVAQRTPCGK